MGSHRVTAAVVAMTAATVLAAGPAIASAASASSSAAGHRPLLVHRDARHDVMDDSGPSSVYHVDPHHSDGDITRIRVRYAAHNLRVHVSFAHLHKPVHGNLVDSGLYELDVTTSAGKNVAISIYASGKKPRGQVHFFAANPRATCAVGHTMNYAGAHLSFTLPAHCFGAARWVRVGFTADLFAKKTGSFDAAFSRGDRDLHDGEAFGPRVYRS
jgi:hypothetical protein